MSTFFINSIKKRTILIILFLIILLIVTTQNNLNKNNYKEKIAESQSMQTTPSPAKFVQIIQEALGIKTAVLQSTIIPLPRVAKKPYSGSFGLVVEDYANKTGAISALETKLNTKISTISFFKQFGNPDNKDLSQSDLAYAKIRGYKLQIAWEPWKSSEKNNQKEDFLKGIPAGKYDKYIRRFADEIKTFGNPVTIRFGHEMNSNWYPWGNRPQEYINAYRHIHSLFTKENVTNVSWMWSVNISENPAGLNEFYPGDDVVDIIGIDGFNFGTTQKYGGWRSFSSLFWPTYNHLSSAYNKPLSISETASAEQGGDKSEWIKNMLSEMAGLYPKINEIIWFNLLKEADWRIDSSQSSLNAFITNLHK